MVVETSGEGQNASNQYDKRKKTGRVTKDDHDWNGQIRVPEGMLAFLGMTTRPSRI